MLNLGDLANPKKFIDPVHIDRADSEFLIQALCMMMLIRETEQCIAELVKSGIANCPCHLAVGQEAISVGVARHLNKQDRVFGNHRSHAQYLALGGDLEELLAEILGKVTGCSKGMGGSMHLYAGEQGFHGSVPIVAGTIPLAVGAALAAKFDQQGSVGVAFFGDGACEEGVLHESLNISSIMKLPMIFVVENNLYSSHLDIQQRQPFDSTSRFAEAHGIPYEVVEGNDVGVVEKAAAKLIQRARDNKGPGFLEAVTFRWLGHVGSNEDIDVGVRRSLEEIKAWKKRDPVQRLFLALEKNEIMSQKEFQQHLQDIKKRVSQAKENALQAPWPKLENLESYVYASTGSE
ncbi:acetoin:2,6-dichlorophenolindophenol oxidoreductase subunit alpha [Caedimonas varicaedens]|uniref:Acetoin:2,6-dichlorophenolindophenol oxidoreductase subunit alpha n=1 Tax=Caedimonas varicaedens TaxID=1629334 RepID=A0A0K8MDL9_9PROT|nr:acetoin:2,6-dichlorophenolindophenol oxidoreductase subunit alpha [Caedimonas varicaedens]